MFSKTGKIYWVAGISLLATLMGCHPDGESYTPENKKNDSTSVYAAAAATLIDTIYAGVRDTAILLTSGEAFIIGHIIANKNRPAYTLPARKGQRVTAILKPLEKGGNVRINQIQQPGGAFDGPFGDSLSYAFKKSGNIRFIIGENLMAGDPYTGNFILHIILSER